MRLFKDIQGRPLTFDENADDRYFENLIEIGAEEFEQLRLGHMAQITAELSGNPSYTYNPAGAALRNALSAEYERRMAVIAADYPPSERESWYVQTAEARMLVADPQAVTPWIDAAAAVRQIDRVDLARRIVAKDANYRRVHGALTGARQRIEDQITAAGNDLAALQLIDVMLGWPE